MKLSFNQEIMSDFFEKQHILGLPFPAVIHHFTDIDRGDPHDHPFNFTSHILRGWYTEETHCLDEDYSVSSVGIFTRKEGMAHKVFASTIHRITGISEGGCYTLIIPEQKVQEPAFYKFEDGQIFRRQWNETQFKPYKI